MNRINLLTIRAFATVLCLLLSACAEEPIDGGDKTEKDSHTITLRLAASVSPIPDTKTWVVSANSSSEAEMAGFYYEMVSSDVEATTPGFNCEMESSRPDSIVVQASTKAASRFKSTYALLFTSTGAFNGCANIGTFTPGTAMDITFTKVKTTTAESCRLVIVTNDYAAVSTYASSAGTGNFDKFTGTYADFQKLTITNEIKNDEDVPYAGDAIFNLSLGEIAATVNISVSRTLTKITLNNSIFNIIGGPGRNNITLYNAGAPRFAPSGTNRYDGTGTTLTDAFVTTTLGGNVSSVTWYVGENIRPAGTGINSAADRNSSKAPENACYIRIASAALSIPVNTSPTIGQEYRPTAENKSFTYDLYLGKSSNLSDFSLRRNTNYTINTEISSTLVEQEQLAAKDGRVTLTKTGGETAGLVIGRFGGFNYASGTGAANTVSGSYTKLLLLEPNTSRATITNDNVTKVWGIEGIQYQTETRKSWDNTYIYSLSSNGMSTAAGSLYSYCQDLTLGNTPKGSWYVPTVAQLQMIWAIYEGLKEGGFDSYSAFAIKAYWSCTENTATFSWGFDFSSGNTFLNNYKTNSFMARCVRDLV